MHAPKIPEILQQHESEIVNEWVREQTAPGAIRDELIREDELRSHCREFLRLLVDATRDGNLSDPTGESYQPLRELLERISASRGEQGFTPSETATFVFSFKEALFARLREEFGRDAQSLADETWISTMLLDKLGLYTTEVFLKSREETIARQQQELIVPSIDFHCFLNDIECCSWLSFF